jgi:hypothetical protein
MVATEHEKREINVGDVVHIKAGERHWHGAKADTTMGHITLAVRRRTGGISVGAVSCRIAPQADRTGGDMFPRVLAEAQFKLASAEAAVFELRMRMLAGTIPVTQDAAIDVKLADIRDGILGHYQGKVTAEETELIHHACTLRNKLLHCEFSAARRKLEVLNPKTRDGGVLRLDFGSEPEKVLEVIAGRNVGQQPVAGTKTRTLRDVYGWLQECQLSNEFDEAAAVFKRVNNILESLPTR